jgi:hypothetical protein
MNFASEISMREEVGDEKSLCQYTVWCEKMQNMPDKK